MAEIFISYQKRDRALAQSLDDALSGLGFSTWWDDHVTPRERWDLILERELKAAGLVLVLWTENSCGSEFVLDEATRAKKADKLIQARFDDVEIPIGFGFRQYVDLDREHPDEGPGWDRLLRWLGVGDNSEGERQREEAWDEVPASAENAETPAFPGPAVGQLPEGSAAYPTEIAAAGPPPAVPAPTTASWTGVTGGRQAPPQPTPLGALDIIFGVVAVLIVGIGLAGAVYVAFQVPRIMAGSSAQDIAFWMLASVGGGVIATLAIPTYVVRPGLFGTIVIGFAGSMFEATVFGHFVRNGVTLGSFLGTVAGALIIRLFTKSRY